MNIESASLFNAIKLHFTSEKYDALKYNFKTKKNFVPENQFYFFSKLEKLYKDELARFYIANLYEDPTKSIFDLVEPEAKEIYNKWKQRNEALSYNFKKEVGILLEKYSLNNAIKITNEYPVLLLKTFRKEISIETLLLMDSVLNFYKIWDNTFKNDLVWKDFKFRSNKYRCFMDINVEKFKEMLKEIVLSYENKMEEIDRYK